MRLPVDTKVPESFVAHPGHKKSFLLAEARAREVLRERGMSERQIEAELLRRRRDHEA
jgi:hypothetical protein